MRYIKTFLALTKAPGLAPLHKVAEKYSSQPLPARHIDLNAEVNDAIGECSHRLAPAFSWTLMMVFYDSPGADEQVACMVEAMLKEGAQAA